MIRRISLSLLAWTFFLLNVGCSDSRKSKSNQKSENEVVDIYHYNILIAPDLSNRVNMNIHPKPISDLTIIDTVLDLIEEVLKHGRETNQKDCYSMLFINQGVINMYGIDQSKLFIDFAVFEKQIDRINFIKGRNEFENSGLKFVKEQFFKECTRFYQKANEKSDGADIWSFFNKGIDQSFIKKAEYEFEYMNQKFRNTYRNILILLTDGYIESGLSAHEAKGVNGNQSFDLGQARIGAFRKAFKRSGMEDMKKFFKNNNYGIVPVNNPYLADLEVLVLELYDRSLTKSGNATVHPTDADILELFWSDWLEKSKVKRYELHRCFTNRRVAKQTIRNFILSNSQKN